MRYGIELGYKSRLSAAETIKALAQIRENLNSELKNEFKLTPVDSAVITDKLLWLNDDFQNTLRPIDFDADHGQLFGEIIQANNKWRRWFLANNGMTNIGDGIITTFNSIWRDVVLTNVNSIVQAELGFEYVVERPDLEILQEAMIKIYTLLLNINEKIQQDYSALSEVPLSGELTFISVSKLRALYPLLSFKERLNKFARDNGAFVLMPPTKIELKHIPDNFSQDVFDFNSYIRLFVYSSAGEKAVELAYIAFGVGKEALLEQNDKLKEVNKTNSGYDHLIMMDKLPLTVSGGINLSKTSMLILQKQHIGEVQHSIWPPDFIKYCEDNEINII